MFKIIELEDIDKGIPYDFINEKSNHQQDFKIGLRRDDCRGMFYENSGRSFVYLYYQESPDEVIDTCVHETIHAAIDHCSGWEDNELEEGKITEEDAFYVDDLSEHDIIRNMMWAEEILT